MIPEIEIDFDVSPSSAPTIEEDLQVASVIPNTVDTTLTHQGQAADAKAVGDRLAEKANITDLPVAVTVNEQAQDAHGNITVTAAEINYDTENTVAQKLAQALSDLTSLSDDVEELSETVSSMSGVSLKTYADNYVSSENDKPQNWNSLGGAVFVRFSGTNPNASSWGFTYCVVLSYATSGIVHQIALETSNNEIYTRVGSVSSNEWTKPWQKPDHTSVRNGTYTLNGFSATGFMASSSTKIEFWIPLPVSGKKVSISATGDVSFIGVEGFLSPSQSHASATVSNAEFGALTYSYRDRTVAGVSVVITAPKWYKQNSTAVATNGQIVNVKFNGSLNVTVTEE